METENIGNNNLIMDLCTSDSSESTSLDILEMLSDTSSTSDSSENEVQEHARVENYIETIQRYSDDDFKRHFRINRTTARYLIERYEISNFYTQARPGGRCQVGAAKEIYMFVWYMGNTNTFREIGNLFGTSKASAWRVVKRVAEWLISIGHEFVKWPVANEITQNITQFERAKRIPGVIGCIDCSHIEIKAPRANKADYFNRKHYYSVHLQAVVNADKKFIDIFVGEPGSLHDSRVLRRSNLHQRAFDNAEECFPHNSFILGDSAYPTLNWLVTPYKDNGSLTTVQTQFNILHSSTRIVIENAFGILKTRFRRLLHFTEQVHLPLITNLIVCGCICLSQNDEMECTNPNVGNLQDDFDHPTQHTENGNRRDQLLTELINRNVILQ